MTKKTSWIIQRFTLTIYQIIGKFVYKIDKLVCTYLSILNIFFCLYSSASLTQDKKNAQLKYPYTLTNHESIFFNSISVLNGISTIIFLFCFTAKDIFIVEKLSYYFSYSSDDKSICPRVNVIVWLELELFYYDITVYLITHDTIGRVLVV